MEKRSVYLILIGLVAIGGLVALSIWDREPEYGGKKLNEWVWQYRYGPGPFGGSEPAEAIGHIGSNAVPYLLKWFRYYDMPSRKSKIYGAINPLIQRLNPAWKLSDEPKAAAAASALIFLGPKADCATGEIMKMLAGSAPSAIQSLWLLQRLGKGSLPQVTCILTNKAFENGGRDQLGAMLAWSGTNGQPMLPVLLDLLKYPEPSVRDGAREAIRGIDPSALEKVEQAR